MGWFWDNKGNGADTNLVKSLDPSLRDFLDEESLRKQSNTGAIPSAAPPRTQPLSTANATEQPPYRARFGLDKADLDHGNQTSAPANDETSVPSESLFQDGRYAHLWKTYRPQSEAELTGRTDQDRMVDVVREYNDRKAAIGRAAVENCVEYQMAEKDCFSNGSWAKRMNMCREEAKSFNRCYTMQTRFLKALGYLSQPRSEDEEERIQMHADKLYHEMIERERIAQEAKAQGLEEPTLPPLIQPEMTLKALGEDSAWAQARRMASEKGWTTNISSFPPERQEEIRKRIEGMSKAEQDLELQLIAAESRAQMTVAEQIRETMVEEKQARLARRAAGKETVGDTIKRLWGWDKE